MDNFTPHHTEHVPVLLEEVMRCLAPRDGGTYVDATLGGGGYTRAILAAADCRVIAIDRDPQAIARAAAWGVGEPRLTLMQGRFGDLVRHLATLGIIAVDGVVADLGMSSDQLDDVGRGFAFSSDGPLDMRMEPAGPTAADLLAELSEGELADLLRRWGDEPDARRIARAIVARRATAPLRRTGELRALVTMVKGRRHHAHDPATRTFQALRIAVNDELGELGRLLEAAVGVLRPGGRLAIVSFHSGEDRLVKQWVEAEAGRHGVRSRHLPPAAQFRPRLVWAQRGGITASAAEVARNPRARSARLRVAVRTDVPAEDGEGPGAQPSIVSRRAA